MFESNCDQGVLGLSSCLVSVVQGTQFRMEIRLCDIRFPWSPFTPPDTFELPRQQNLVPWCRRCQSDVRGIWLDSDLRWICVNTIFSFLYIPSLLYFDLRKLSSALYFPNDSVDLLRLSPRTKQGSLIRRR